MLTKEFSITLDMVRENTFRPFEVVECDTGNRLHIEMCNNGEPMALSNCNVCIVFASKNGFRMQDLTSGVSIGADGKSLDVELYAESFGPGEVTADVQVYSGEQFSTLITSKRFTFRCITALMSPDIIAASATYPPLIAATKAASDAAAEAREAAANLSDAVGEMNVQADWLETDETKDGYIKNKPFIPKTAEDVGAMPENATAKDIGALPETTTPADIGALPDSTTPGDIGAIPTSQKGSANGVATLNDNGKVTAEQACSGVINIDADTTISETHLGSTLKVNGGYTISIPYLSSIPVGSEIEIYDHGSDNGCIITAVGDTYFAYDGYNTKGKTLTLRRYGVCSLKKMTGMTWKVAGEVE